MVATLSNILLATARLKMFKQNILVLIGILIVGAVLLVVLFAAWVALRAWLWNRTKAASDRERYREKYAPDGQPYPPAAAGVCDRCGRTFGKVYYLPDGQRLCPKCFA